MPLTFFKVLETALAHLAIEADIQPQEVHEVEIELDVFVGKQCCVVNFPEYHYVCFTYGDWRLGDFIGYYTDRCYYCDKVECQCKIGVA